MRNQIITAFENKKFADRKEWPDVRPGDTVQVSYRVSEGGKSRVQMFEGVVIRRKRGTADSSFTVRKIAANGIGVERVFPLYSSNIENLKVKARGIVRRSRLYYLRELSGKAARIRSKFGAAVTAEAKKREAEPAVNAEEAKSVAEADTAAERKP